MDKRTAIETDLSKAREALAGLQDELPQYHALLTENEQDAQRLKTERASLDAQSQARGRVQIAKEMLEQHHADIQSARAEVARLEALEQREATLKQMADHAQRTTKHRKALEKTVHETSAVLGKALETMAQAFAGIRDERTAFALVGAQLAPEFNGHTAFSGSIQGNEKKAVCLGVLSELEARGADLTDALNSTTGTYSRVDRDMRPLPTPEHAHLLWQIFSETIAHHDRHILHNVYLPIKPQPVQVREATSGADAYQI